MSRFRLLPLALLALALPAFTLRIHAQLSADIARIADQAHGRVGVACSLPGKELDCNLNSGDPFPMQSVYKFPIAMATLHAVEEHHLRLDQQVRFLPSDLVAPDQYSPLRDAHPQANVDVSIEELLHLAVSQSDGVASDILMRTLGGAGAVDDYVRHLGIHGIHIMDTEKTLGTDVKLEDRNSAEPRAMVALLRLVADRSPLTPEHTLLLLDWMTASHIGDRRIKALLPPGTVVADKTGTSGTARNVTNATNDVALITLPDGRKLALAVFVADSAAPAATREQVIAQIAKAVYDAATH
jgi:beta-lactamase class A